MQIQAPRTVLAEAAMDALFLSYADPELAAEVILWHFESSPHPNLPCMREDGSYNADKITITPALPQALRRVVATYRIAPIPCGTNVLGIECTVRDSKGYTVRVLCERRKMEKAAEGVEKGELPRPGTAQRSEWEGTWGEGRTLLLPLLMTTSIQ